MAVEAGRCRHVCITLIVAPTSVPTWLLLLVFLSLCKKSPFNFSLFNSTFPLCLPHKPKPSSPLSGLPISRTRMALKFSLAFALLVIWAVVQAQSAHHSHAAAPAPSAADCSSLIMNMADCLSFVSSGSTEEKPMGTCCAGLKTVLKTDAECLCEAFKSSGSLGVTLNMTKAMSLPAACKVQAPPAAQCGLSLTPSGAPAGISPSSVAGGPASSTSANEQAPAPAPANTAAALFSSISLVLGHLVVALVSCF